jgi:hypothetical protein
MASRSSAKTIRVAGGIVLGCALLFLLLSSNWVKGIYNNLVLDSRDHFLSCSQLPTIEQVNRILIEHHDVVEQIEAVYPGYVFVVMGMPNCPGKADILILYPNHQDRLAIEKIINGKTFFGIPYRLHNI